MAKERVENCLILDVLELTKPGYLKEGATSMSRWEEGGRVIGTVACSVKDGALQLTYTVTIAGVKTNYSYPVSLVRTPATLGGERVWFACPGCARRVRMLYLPPAGGRFLCRACHDLSYASRQKRRSAEMKAWEELPKLQAELERPGQPGRRWRETYAKTTKLIETLGELGPLGEGAPQPLLPSMPKRRPGRPSKWELRERARAGREAAQALLVKRPPGRPRQKRPYVRRQPLKMSERKSDMEVYCVKCRDRRQLIDPVPVTLANGHPALASTCPVCGTKVKRIVKAAKETIEGSATL